MLQFNRELEINCGEYLVVLSARHPSSNFPARVQTRLPCEPKVHQSYTYPHCQNIKLKVPPPQAGTADQPEEPTQ